jgi:hypothetical protein
MLKVIFLVEGELSFAFFCPFGYIPHPLDAPLLASLALSSPTFGRIAGGGMMPRSQSYQERSPVKTHTSLEAGT